MSEPLTVDREPASGGTGKALHRRLMSLHVGKMLFRNTVVSTLAFIVGLGVLWELVTQLGVNTLVAGGISFMVTNTIHYALCRAWIFRGTDRGMKSGYALFLLNALVGLAVTLGLYAAFLAFTPINYLVARIVVSVFAGLVIFVLNAVVNFRRV